jgi:hypothetical protein
MSGKSFVEYEVIEWDVVAYEIAEDILQTRLRFYARELFGNAAKLR